MASSETLAAKVMGTAAPNRSQLSPGCTHEVHLSICLLSDVEIGRLKHYDIQPCHKSHRHLRNKEALTKLNSGELVLIEHNGQQYVSEDKLYFLAVRNSGGIGVVQRVKMNPPAVVTPAEDEMLTFEQERILK